jgi:hypothetical protein
MLFLLLQVSLGDAELDGFRVKIIDTCGLEDPEAGDTVNYTVRTAQLQQQQHWELALAH